MAPLDLQQALREWPHDPEQVSVRKIVDADGAVRIQMRVELGILQMESSGRPDGTRPHGGDSLLSHHQDRLARHERRNGTTLGFTLSPRDCQDLRLEASHFYRRFVAFFVLEEYDGVLRDTAHARAIFDLCRDFAFERDDQICMEPYRPYVLMMETKARAYQSLQDGEPASALAHVNRGILQIRSLFEPGDDGQGAEGCSEVRLLHSLACELAGKIPADAAVVKHKALRAALADERFEDAAKLRDALHSRKDSRR